MVLVVSIVRFCLVLLLALVVSPQQNGFVLNGSGFSAGDWALTGCSVSVGGDINGDNFADILITTQTGSYDGSGYNGYSYVVFGKHRAAPFSSYFDLSTLNGSNGFKITGLSTSSESNIKLSFAGDLNGDSYGDILIGAAAASTGYVIYGKAIFSSSIGVTSGLIINGLTTTDSLGGSVSGGGNVNGDGFNDIIIGAAGVDIGANTNAGQAYVIFGGSSLTSPFNLNSLTGSNGFIINGLAANDQLGFTVSIAGNINGDSYDDILISSFTGKVYVIFGKTTPFTTPFNLGSLAGSNGFTITGSSGNDNFGYSVSLGGDINKDGYDDILIGATLAVANGKTDSGKTYVIFGKNSFSSTLSVGSLTGTNGFMINGINTGDYSGYSVSNGGDINGDGIDDILIGAPFAGSSGKADSGQSYVIFGKSTGFSASFDLSSLTGSNGFAINGIAAADKSGYSVSIGGDINGDSIHDILIGAPFATVSSVANAGQVYVMFGKTTPFPATINPSDFAIFSALPSSTSSVSRSRTPSVSRSCSISTSPSKSRSISLTPSSSRTPSISLTPSKSQTPSISRTPAVSISGSKSSTPSISVSPSKSRNPSTTLSPSKSLSPSVSHTPSISISPSKSRVPSISLSSSNSRNPSISLSSSKSPAASVSHNPSISTSPSKSRSPSISLLPTKSSIPSSSPLPVLIFANITLQDVTVEIEQDFFFQIQQEQFMKQIGQKIVYSATVSSSSLPSWLNFSQIDLKFEGQAEKTGTFQIIIVGQNVNGTVTATVLLHIVLKQREIVIPSNSEQIKSFSFQVPDPSGGSFHFEAQQVTGKPLPSFIIFNSTAHRLSVDSTIKIQPQTVFVTITGSDDEGNEQVRYDYALVFGGDTEDSTDDLDIAPIIGGTIGGVVLLALIVIVVVLIIAIRKSKILKRSLDSSSE